jgi:protein TonB
MSSEQQVSILKTYEVYVPAKMPVAEILFKTVFVVVLSLFIGFGLYLNGIEPPVQQIAEKIDRIKTQFLIEEKKKVIKAEPKKKEIKKKKVKKKPEEPVDLTKKPVMKPKLDDIKSTVTTTRKKVRRVYGLKRVYSKGIGAGGSLANAVVGKLGNTLEKDVDTVTATKEEIIKGEVVSTTTVTTAPRFKRRVKPEYTQEMLDNEIEGVIKVKVLVDVDGKIKKAIALNDLGFGSKDIAVKACFKMLFEPAKRGDVPVAVWIIIPIKFVLLG